MSTQLVDVHRPDLPPPALSVLPEHTARLPLVDRASLRVGVWLLLRSARNARRHADHTVHAHRMTSDRARSAREAAALRLHQLAPRV